MKAAALPDAAAFSFRMRPSRRDLNGDVTDAVGEIASMIAGAAKTKFEGSTLSIGLPTVVFGKNYLVTFPSQSTPISLPVDSDLGAISVDIGLPETAY